MKHIVLVISMLLLIVSCGSSSSQTTDTASGGGISSTEGIEGEVVSTSTTDSVLLASFIELGRQINNIDSLLLVIQSADSMMRDSILNLILGDTLTHSSMETVAKKNQKTKIPQ